MPRKKSKPMELMICVYSKQMDAHHNGSCLPVWHSIDYAGLETELSLTWHMNTIRAKEPAIPQGQLAAVLLVPSQDTSETVLTIRTDYKEITGTVSLSKILAFGGACLVFQGMFCFMRSVNPAFLKMDLSRPIRCVSRVLSIPSSPSGP